MRMADLGDVQVHYRIDGDPDGAPVVFANSLGTDMRLWDQVVPLLPGGLQIIRFDKRGHGLSSLPPAPYTMGALVRDAERLLDRLEVRGCVFVGLSIGGMIAQGLAVKRLDLVRAMVLSNTGARIGTPEIWADRIAAVRAGGVEALADATMERWFSRGFRATPELQLWRNMLVRTPAEGYVGCSAAISGTDFFTPTSGLRLPVLGIAGSEDGGTPPDLVRETVNLVPGSKFQLIRRAGHLPCVERPREYADILAGFLRETGHVWATDRNKANALAFHDLMFNRCRRREAIETYAGATYVQHNPHVADGKEAFIAYFERMAAEYPGKITHFKRAIAEGDLVALQCHQIWPGSDDYAGIDIFRFDDAGKIVEHWDVLQIVTGRSRNDNGLF